MHHNRLLTSVTAIQKVSFLLSMLISLTACGFASAQDAAHEADPPVAAAAATTEGVVEGVVEGIAEAGESALPGFILLGIVIALFVVPLLLGNYLAKSFRMPDYGWKFAVAIGTLAAAAVVVYQGEIKFGPDLSGGITLKRNSKTMAAATPLPSARHVPSVSSSNN